MPVEQAPAFQFYVKEWRSSRAVQRMTFAQRGMYLEMLLEQWESLSLPDSPTECAAIIGGTEAEWIEAWPVLRRKFVDRRRKGRPLAIQDPNAIGRIVNLRLEQARKDRRSYVKRARKGGISRALSAKRGKDGTYSPAKDPAKAPAKSQQDNQLSSSTPSPSSSPPPSPVQPPTVAVARGPLIARHRMDAAFQGPRVYVPQRLHEDFLRFRNNPLAEAELADWYQAVSVEWAEGARKHDEVGADMFAFWRARYAEKWPPTKAAAPAERRSGVPDAEASRVRRREMFGG